MNIYIFRNIRKRLKDKKDKKKAKKEKPKKDPKVRSCYCHQVFRDPSITREVKKEANGCPSGCKTCEKPKKQKVKKTPEPKLNKPGTKPQKPYVYDEKKNKSKSKA